jgi:hypothetical protein
MEKLHYNDHQNMVFAGNAFINVPVILRHEDVPLIQFVKRVEAGFETEFTIHHRDGVKLAVAKGSQLYRTKDGEKAGVTLRHLPGMTVCKLGDQVLYEMRRDEAAALSTAAELYTPNGYLLKCASSVAPELLNSSGESIQWRGNRVLGCSFTNCDVGVWVKSTSIDFGVWLPKQAPARGGDGGTSATGR